jgi:adenine-specific DNA methylase
MVLPVERVRAQLAEQHGGADAVFDANGNRTSGAQMLAVVTLHPGMQGRNYRLPADRDYQAVWKAQKRLKVILDEWELGGKRDPCPVPNEPLPKEREKGNSGFRVLLYGISNFGDLFSARQKVALSVLGKKVKSRSGSFMRDALGLVVSRLSDYGSAQTTWVPSGEFIRGTFGRQALPIVWDFSEPVPWTESSGNFEGAIDWVARVIEAWPQKSISGQVQLADATHSPLPDQTSAVWFTDPPYYDAVAYSDLSDFFLVWLKRSLPDRALLQDPFDAENCLSPKFREAVQDWNRKQSDGRVKDRDFYESQMANAFAEGRRVLRGDGIGSVVFAHKTTEGWEALLSGITRGGLTITGSWPIATERPGRLISIETAALATSVHLICRPRPDDAPVGDWAEVLRELPNRVGNWMERLQGESIRGADLVFACIGPALEIFSRYRKVETADGSEVKLAEYLEKVWEVVGRTALEQILGTAEARARNGMAGVLEEDARLTALFLWTLQSTNGQNGTGSSVTHDVDSEEDSGVDDDEEETPKDKTKGYSLVFDVVRRFAQPLGIGLPKWEGRIIETRKGVVRLLAVSERLKQLFGEDGTDVVADLIEHDPRKDYQQLLFPELEAELPPRFRGRGRSKMSLSASAIESDSLRGATTLDRVHAAMLLQAGGQANALRMLIKAEQDRGPDFLRLANALSALYPKGSEEKRLLDAMLLAAPR